MLLSEEKLPVKIWNLNLVVISYKEISLLRAAKPHQAEHFNVLAAQSATSDQKVFLLQKILLQLSSKDHDLIIISAVFGLPALNLLRNAVKPIPVEPLADWAVFSGEFDDFLGQDSAQKWG